jgi:hypothetical protein
VVFDYNPGSLDLISELLAAFSSEQDSLSLFCFELH